MKTIREHMSKKELGATGSPERKTTSWRGLARACGAAVTMLLGLVILLSVSLFGQGGST